MMNNKNINNRTGSNQDKNKIQTKNKNKIIKNFHDTTNSNNTKADKVASKYDNSEAFENIKNFNLNKNLNSNNQNVFQNNYNLNREKGSNLNSDVDSGFSKIERGSGGILNYF